MADPLRDLFDRARAARKYAHAPYSRYPVGAAIRVESGAIFSGCNVENAAYPSGLCAESGAIAAMVVAGERRITDVLVVGGEARTIAPCGACRQRIFEFSTDKTLVYLANASGIVRGVPLGELLPRAFGPRDLAAGNRVSDRDEQ
jgi:cytidine deaminase